MAPATTIFTVVTTYRRLKSGAVARLPAGDSSASLQDDPSRFVSQYHRINARCIPYSALGEIVQIGSANSHGRYPHLYFAGKWFPDGTFVEAEPVLRREFGYAHLLFEKTVERRARVLRTT